MGRNEDRAEYIRRLVDDAPPLSPAVRDRLAELLRPAQDEEGKSPPTDAA